jgi:hypothetical protein
MNVIEKVKAIGDVSKVAPEEALHSVDFSKSWGNMMHRKVGAAGAGGDPVDLRHRNSIVRTPLNLQEVGTNRNTKGMLQVLLPKEHKTKLLSRAVMAEPDTKEAQHEAVQLLLANPRLQLLLVMARKMYMHRTSRHDSVRLSNGSTPQCLRPGGCNHFSEADAYFLKEATEFVRSGYKAQLQEEENAELAAIEAMAQGKSAAQTTSPQRQEETERKKREMKYLNHITSEAIERFRHALLRHRHNLSYKESVVGFDAAWHLSMVRADDAINGRAKHQYFFRGGAELVMNEEIELALKGAQKHYITIKKLAPSLRGAELLRTFVLTWWAQTRVQVRCFTTNFTTMLTHVRSTGPSSVSPAPYFSWCSYSLSSAYCYLEPIRARIGKWH